MQAARGRAKGGWASACVGPSTLIAWCRVCVCVCVCVCIVLTSCTAFSASSWKSSTVYLGKQRRGERRVVTAYYFVRTVFFVVTNYNTRQQTIHTQCTQQTTRRRNRSFSHISSAYTDHPPTYSHPHTNHTHATAYTPLVYNLSQHPSQHPLQHPSQHLTNVRLLLLHPRPRRGGRLVAPLPPRRVEGRFECGRSIAPAVIPAARQALEAVARLRRIHMF
jgi:hypothetical protein